MAIGFDGNEDLQRFVKDGTLDAIAVQSSFQMGQLCVQTVNEVLQRKPVPKFRDTGVMLVNRATCSRPRAPSLVLSMKVDAHQHFWRPR